MISFKRLYYLVLQEIRSASRSRYIVISFVLMPIFMWGLQGGVQVLVGFAITSESEGEALYITNDDLNLPNITLTESFNLPFDFDGYEMNSEVTNINLAKYLIESIKYIAENDNSSTLYGIAIITDKTFDEVNESAQEGNVNFWLHINDGFASNYNSFNASFADLELHYLQSGLLGPTIIQAGIQTLLGQPPFTIVEIEKVTTLAPPKQILLGGETGEEGFGAGFAGFIAILIAVLVPAPFVSTSFAGEREKKTMEALLALPLSRRSILLGKLSAGMVLVGVFALMNIVGMYLFSYILENFIDYGTGEDINILVIDLNPVSIVAITAAMFLSAFISIGIGISIASLTKDVRTAESMYSFGLMLPTMAVGMLGIFGGTPESYGTAGLLLYIIPWSHSLAIFQKISRPEFYDVKSIFGMGLWIDLLFHIVALLLIIGIILYIAAKVFEREGIVN